LIHNWYGYLDVSVGMWRWLKNRCGVVARFERQLIWLEDAMADRLSAMRGLGESYSDVIMRIAGQEALATRRG
jgi:hypothetical protein